MYAQAYFAYDAKKSGGVTVSHLRFGRSPIRSSYLINKADFVACHNQSYVNKYNVLAGLRLGGKFLLNCEWDLEKLETNLPGAMKRYIAKNAIRFYTINAAKIAADIGLGGRINMIMQAAFFKLTAIIPIDDAITYLKESLADDYGKQGQRVIEMNYAAVEQGMRSIVAITTPECWKNAADSQADVQHVACACSSDTVKADLPEFVKEVAIPMNRQEGDTLPVSVFNGREDGSFPCGTTAYEKRGIAADIPKWVPDRCIQCNQCSFVCPHAVIRPLLISQAEMLTAPSDIETKPAIGFPAMQYHLAISPLDCTGCGNCFEVCPAKEKALAMKPLASQLPSGEKWWEFATTVSAKPIEAKQLFTVKGSQFSRPLQEFSGACAGCGETPYAKLITQLVGDRMMISNAAGCSTVWGASAPSTSYTPNEAGCGPAWGFSLFEDNAEYGLGMHIGVMQLRKALKGKMEDALTTVSEPELRAAMADWLQHMNEGDGARERADRLIVILEKFKGQNGLLNEIFDQRDYLVKRSQWIFGGDGWAYDIGYGGLDHVLASGEDVNVLVFDTEVYSNTGGQSSKATPTAAMAQFAASGKKTRKKDLGVMAMSYGYVYVAQIAMGADRNQTLKAITEAEAYPGPSLVIAYAPCVNHGIRGGMRFSQMQAKKAVESGYWSLYRYNPQRKDQGVNPFTLDSKEPTASFQDFLMSEVRYAGLARQFPETAQELFAKAEKDATDRRDTYKRLASQ
jgi:pyruvate-ferredoxin/flavodoxin oxidoreductase